MFICSMSVVSTFVYIHFTDYLLPFFIVHFLVYETYAWYIYMWQNNICVVNQKRNSKEIQDIYFYPVTCILIFD